MATRGAVILLLFVYFLPDCSCFGLFDDFAGDTTSCEQSCADTYPLHTYEKSQDLRICQRGCRLFSIIDFIDDFSSVNETRNTCAAACQEAYAEADTGACIQGCNSQVNTAYRRQRQMDQYYSQETSFLYPMMYVHNIYSNMVDKLQNHMSVSWSFYAQSDNGRLVVLKSEPKLYIDGVESPLEYKTSNYIESNLEPVDNSATPNLKNSQMQRSLDGYSHEGLDDQGQPTDWLSCISYKTGMPRLFLSLVILMSALVMIWLCVTTAVTAPEHRVKVQPQKLSFYGDLDYLNELDEKKMMTAVRPQIDGTSMAPALPLKIKVEAI